MKIKDNEKLVLALETGIGVGSIAVFSRKKEIFSRVQIEESGKFEGILETIKFSFDRCHAEIGDLGKIIVSNGPGSYTGLRIGLAVGKGLKTALGIELTGVSVLDAMISDASLITLAVVPLGNKGVCWKISGRNEKKIEGRESDIKFAPLDIFLKKIVWEEIETIVLPEELFSKKVLEELGSKKDLQIIDCGNNFARMIGLLGMSLENVEEPVLVYPGSL